MAGRLTTNIRCNIAAPYDLKLNTKQNMNGIIENYFNKRGKCRLIKEEEKYEITSYKFGNGCKAEIKIKVHYAIDGSVYSIDVLGTFDSFRKYLVETINLYKDIIKGFVKYLDSISGAWYVDTFVFRVHPVPFMRQYKSRIGDLVYRTYTIMRMKNGDYCILKGDRLEYRSMDWNSDIIDTIVTIIKRYTRS